MTLLDWLNEAGPGLIGSAIGGSATVAVYVRRIARAEIRRAVKPIVERVELLETAQGSTTSAVRQLRKVVNAHE